MNLRHQLAVSPGKPVKLADWDPDDTLGLDKDGATETMLAKNIARLDELQYLMYAEHRRALLVILQGMDASGKDGTIRHVMTGLNPQGCRVTAFKAPVGEEVDRDFLWRVHRAVPGKGDIAIFTTPLAFRWVHFRYAIDKGINVFMEKPLIADGVSAKKM